MRKRYSAVLATAGLLALSGTAAADPGTFGFGIFIGAPAPVYVAPPAPPVHYSPRVHAAPHAYVAPMPAHHGARYVERHASRDAYYERDAHRYYERDAHEDSHRGGHRW